MAATVHIERQTGSGAGTGTDITSINTRMAQNDTHATGGASNPIPAVTTSYSYWVSTRLNVTVAAANDVTNLQWYSDGTQAGTGLTIAGQAANSGANAGYRQATSAIVLNTSNHTGLTGAPNADVTNQSTGFIAAAKKSLAGSAGTSTGQFGDFFVYQLAVTSSASPGPISARTFTWQYDET